MIARYKLSIPGVCFGSNPNIQQNGVKELSDLIYLQGSYSFSYPESKSESYSWKYLQELEWNGMLDG